MAVKEWSIIIPTLNEERNIAFCLESLCRLSYPQEALEVLLVDNGSSDKTVSIAKSYSATLDVCILSIPRARVGAVRNVGASLAKARFFAFLDADCIVEPLWLQRAARVLTEHPSAIVGAHYDIPEDASWAASVWHRRFHAGRSGAVSYIPGGNLLMASTTFWLVGGFDPNLRSNEDSQFCSRARAARVQVLAFPYLATKHLGAEKNLAHFARRQVWHGGNVISRSALRGNVRAIGLAAFTLACLFFAVLGTLIWLPQLVLVALLAILLPPLLMALRGRKLRERGKDFPPLVLLLLTYAVVRACVLPLALIRGARQWSARELSS